jgi:hypothetical protein
MTVDEFANADNRHVIAVAGIHPHAAILDAAAVVPRDSGQSSPSSVSPCWLRLGRLRVANGIVRRRVGCVANGRG